MLFGKAERKGEIQDSKAWYQGLTVYLEVLRGLAGQTGSKGMACPCPALPHQRVPPSTTGAQPTPGISLGHHGQTPFWGALNQGEAKGDWGALSPPVRTRRDGMLLEGKPPG